MSLYSNTTTAKYEQFQNGKETLTVISERGKFKQIKYRFKHTDNGLIFDSYSKSGAKRTTYGDPNSIPKWVWQELQKFLN